MGVRVSQDIITDLADLKFYLRRFSSCGSERIEWYLGKYSITKCEKVIINAWQLPKQELDDMQASITRYQLSK